MIKSYRKIKPYEDLNFTNDFMFCRILETNETICRNLLELIIGEKIQKIHFLNKQETIDIALNSKGIRLDLYLEDSDSVYDVEMQAIESKNLPKRSRYYQSIIDTQLLSKGTDYRALKRSYIIFICVHNPFDGERHKYTFESSCNEDPSLKLGDDTIKIFVTPSGRIDDISDEMADFLNYLLGAEPASELTKQIDMKLEEAKLQEEWRKEYMTQQMKDIENIEKGIEIGREEGRVEGREDARLDMVKTFLLKNYSTEQLCELSFSEEEIHQAEKELFIKA